MEHWCYPKSQSQSMFQWPPKYAVALAPMSAVPSGITSAFLKLIKKPFCGWWGLLVLSDKRCVFHGGMLSPVLILCTDRSLQPQITFIYIQLSKHQEMCNQAKWQKHCKKLFSEMSGVGDKHVRYIETQNLSFWQEQTDSNTTSFRWARIQQIIQYIWQGNSPISWTSYP